MAKEKEYEVEYYENWSFHDTAMVKATSRKKAEEKVREKYKKRKLPKAITDDMIEVTWGFDDVREI